ncbi:hypothetical protein BDZ90DRAFT_231655 [Jaminaea rosea]|uniref:Uncharacterized protein n=1 Tax=Jaminaea rosea TaxID=1569628 RepID=A0A316UU84_9BASI|nr:hypothetical protein BDZ90DRAFT_231655 [Jaminaea rosea]PWN27881.1 hypothetical protein BDZ90DRAFT_231655 [Jaminaea rosea]
MILHRNIFALLPSLAFILVSAAQREDEGASPLGLTPRDDPKIEDLLNSCPGSKIRSPIEGADNCMWTRDNDLNQPHDVVKQLGDPLPNCSGDKQNITKAVTDTTTFDSTFSMSTSVNVDFPGISAGLTHGESHTSTTAEGKGVEMNVAPGTHSRFIAKQEYRPTSGHVLINYGNRVPDKHGHYYWTVSNVILDLPAGEPVTGIDVKPCDQPF